jgi:hypothetical protein
MGAEVFKIDDVTFVNVGDTISKENAWVTLEVELDKYGFKSANAKVKVFLSAEQARKIANELLRRANGIEI